MSKMFGFSPVFSSKVIIFDCVIGFNELKSVLEYLTVTDFMPPLFGFLNIFDAL